MFNLWVTFTVLTLPIVLYQILIKMNNANYNKIYLPYADYNQYHQDSNDVLGSQLRIMLSMQDIHKLILHFIY